jgi:hypothetical protein
MQIVVINKTTGEVRTIEAGPLSDGSGLLPGAKSGREKTMSCDIVATSVERERITDENTSGWGMGQKGSKRNFGRKPRAKFARRPLPTWAAAEVLAAIMA